ncbi:superoxide dismutase [Caulobacter sp. KR2-114]|uniref:superoxide dismutase n=1 Tax=Caulobacter sp. KR2-114 TaxID=3400912 RepID=UPI003C081FCC
MFKLPDLPYAYDALQPTLSDKTLHFHHDKHHATYVNTLNDLLQKAGKSPSSLEEVIIESARGGEKKVFNNAAQIWNHTFFWTCMTPRMAAPTGDLSDAITQAFGGVEQLKTAFVAEGVGHFGSGWVWLLAEKGGALSIKSTHDAEDLVTQADVTPLLVCDLWEHAYYLDHQNNRKGFLEAWFDALPNWEFAAAQLAAAKGQGAAWRHPAPVPAEQVA